MLPIPGIPSLIGILESNGIECEYLNLSAEYFCRLNPADVLSYSAIVSSFYKNKEYMNYPESFRRILIDSEAFCSHNETWLKKNIKNMDLYKKICKNKKLLYNPFLFCYFTNFADNIVRGQSLLNICSKIYDSETEFSINIDDLLFIFNSPLNNYDNFYRESVSKILDKKPDIIGVQVTLQKDLISAMLLCYLIKQKNKNVHINIGGSYFDGKHSVISNLKEFFGVFFDSISVGESTKTVIDITKYLNNETDIEQVSGLLYCKDDEIKLNPCVKENVNRFPFQSFTGYDWNHYFLPDLILPVRASMTNSCYWGKCIYCTCSGSKEKYRVMSVSRFVDEIEYLAKKYNTKYFSFWDNAFHPIYLEKLADAIIERKLDIRYSLFARLEKEFSYDLLKKVHKSGCRVVFWGLDSASQRVSDFINKGIDVNEAKYILKNSHRAGMLNNLYLMFGHPSETKEEMKANLDFVKENRKNINTVFPIDKIFFLENSVINQNYDYYKGLINQSDDFIAYKNSLINKINSITNSFSKIYMFYLWQYLYFSKYGKLWHDFFVYLFILCFHGKLKFLRKILTVYYNFLYSYLRN